MSQSQSDSPPTYSPPLWPTASAAVAPSGLGGSSWGTIVGLGENHPAPLSFSAEGLQKFTHVKVLF